MNVRNKSMFLCWISFLLVCFVSSVQSEITKTITSSDPLVECDAMTIIPTAAVYGPNDGSCNDPDALDTFTEMCAGSTTCSLANKDFVKCDRDIKLKNYKLVVSWECTLSYDPTSSTVPVILSSGPTNAEPTPTVPATTSGWSSTPGPSCEDGPVLTDKTAGQLEVSIVGQKKCQNTKPVEDVNECSAECDGKKESCIPTKLDKQQPFINYVFTCKSGQTGVASHPNHRECACFPIEDVKKSSCKATADVHAKGADTFKMNGKKCTNTNKYTLNTCLGKCKKTKKGYKECRATATEDVVVKYKCGKSKKVNSYKIQTASKCGC